MLKIIFRHNACRRFSTSRIWKTPDDKVTKPAQNVAPPKNTHSNNDFANDVKPSEFYKTVLVWSGKYKSKAEIPPRVSFDAIDRAKSHVRIKGSIVLMVLCLMGCGYYIWSGKKKSREMREQYNISEQSMERKY